MLMKSISGVRGRYMARHRAGTNLVLLSPDVAEYFPDEQNRQYDLAYLDSRGEETSARRALSTRDEQEKPKSKATWFGYAHYRLL